MAKKLNQHVMKFQTRTDLEAIYAEALEISAEDVTPHIWGGATVVLTDAQLAWARKNVAGLEELSQHGNSGKITVVIPAGLDYIAQNRPTLSEEERAAKKSAGKGVDRAASEARKSRIAELRKRLVDLHGIDLDSEE